MSRLRRYLVAGSRRFNNYFIFYRQLKWYLPQDAIIVNGGADGADQLAKVYAECNGHIYEAYDADWRRFGKQAGTIRNRELSKMIAEAVFFWDGESPSTKELIEFVKQRGIKPLIVTITENDIIKPHPDLVKMCKREPYDVYIGRGNGSMWGNPYAISDTRNREYVVALYTDYLLKKPSLLQHIFELKDKTLGCDCAPQLCHGDILVWLLQNAESEIKEIILENVKETLKEFEEPKKPIVNIQDEVSRWDKNPDYTQVCTSTNLVVANDYFTSVVDNNKVYIGVFEKSICKENLYLSRIEREKLEEDPVNIYYKTVDGSKCEIFYRNKTFGDSPFKVGIWYIESSKVHPYNPGVCLSSCSDCSNKCK